LPLLTEGLPADLSRIHILGICGTAMGALAGMLHDAGYEVRGSDTGIYPPMSDYLASLGVPVLHGWDPANLDYGPDLVVIGNVMRAEYAEVQATLERDLPYCSFPYLLGERFLREAHSTVIAGTHGKTTTTAITAWLCEVGGLDPGFLIGGIAANFPRTARAGGGARFVIEGDEYDTAFFDKKPKFLHYRPNTVVLTSVEFDHADIYADLDHVKRSFRDLMAIIPDDGLLIVRADDPGAAEVAASCAAETWDYGPGAAWDGRIEAIDTDRGVMRFAILRDRRSIGTFESALVGEHNL
jgi:UDP-N-acetylmuramate: L-alanyl-gamma-D-glutamyl-meso-diaminopimelate ligase